MSSRPLERRRTVWLGAAGTGTAFGVLRSIRDAWGDAVRIVASDINPRYLVAASALADAFERAPLVSDAAFTPFLLSGLARYDVDTYVPILDEEIVLAAELKEAEKLSPELAVCAPSSSVAALCFDKLAMAAWLSEHHLPTPRTEAAELATFRAPGLLLKPRRGRGSLGVRLVRSPSELRDALAGEEPLVAQEICRAPEITVDAFIGPSTSRALCRERIEVKAGVCTKARVFEDAGLSAIVRRLADLLPFSGAFCVQFMRAPDRDEWLVTDVNPRPGAGTRMSAAVGVDFLAAMIAASWGDDPSVFLPPLERERYVVRQYAEYVL